jgi:outer membrane protein
MKKIIGLSLVLSSVLAFGTVALADDASICVVQVAKVLHDSPQVQKDVETLKAQFKKDQDAVEAKQKALEKSIKDFKKDEAVLSATDKGKKEKSIVEQRQGVVREVGDFQQKLSAAQKVMMDSVFKDLNGVIQSVAKAKACDVVLDSQFVLFATPARDVTADVAKEFDEK